MSKKAHSASTSRFLSHLLLIFSPLAFLACTGSNASNAALSSESDITTTKSLAKSNSMTTAPDPKNLDTITLGAGCFWCIEAQFLILDGVHNVVSGYTGGAKPNPSYKEVCSGTTGHAEVVQVTFDNTKLGMYDILQAFFKAHDPTQINRQGNDVGTQYRSAIFYHSEEQKQIATKVIEELQAAKIYDKPIATEVTPLDIFYKAEDYHQNYYTQNTSEAYCLFVIQPKLDKFKEVFKDKLKAK